MDDNKVSVINEPTEKEDKKITCMSDFLAPELDLAIGELELYTTDDKGYYYF